MIRPGRILVAQNVTSQRNGGMSRIMGLIHDEIARDGHIIDYFCSDQLPSGLTARKARLLFPWFVRRHVVNAAAAGRPFDIVNVHEPSGAGIIAFKHRAGNPAVVATSHGLEQRGWDLTLEEKRLGRGGLSIRSRLLQPLLFLPQAKWTLRNADHILCLNSQDQEYLVSVLNRPVDTVTRIYPGAGDIYDEVARERDYSSRHRLLFAGTWLPRKGIQDLVPAFCLLAERYPDVELTILDAGTPENSIRSSFPDKLRSRVVRKQANSEAENAAILRESDIYILPSLFEGTPLTLIEAMRSGMPIVTTATCGMKDVIRHGETGLLAPLRSPYGIRDAASSLLDNADLRARIGRVAHEQARQHYSWRTAAEPVRLVYDRLFRRRN
jgi:glycosyltransferase involved in cell wall biosynthesis